MIQSVMLVGDDEETSRVTKLALQVGFHIKQVATYKEGLVASSQAWFDLVILAPDANYSFGLESLKSLVNIPSSYKSPIVVVAKGLSANQEADYLRAGAVDVVSSDAPVDLIQARLLVAMGKYVLGCTTEKKVGDLILDLAEQKAYFFNGNQRVNLGLSSFEVKLVDYLVSHMDQVIPRDQFITNVWGEGVHVLGRTVDAHISRIRRKLAQCSHNIVTVYGEGYKFQSQKQKTSNTLSYFSQADTI